MAIDKEACSGQTVGGLKRRRRRFPVASLYMTTMLLVASAVAPPVRAQSEAAADSSESSLRTIIVTATRRKTNIQQTPISIAVVSSQALQKSGALSYSDYLTMVPGVAFNSDARVDQIVIDGISQEIGARTDATTGAYIDDALVSEVDAGLADIGTFDLDRVEVLRGPQGTLFGSLAMGGVVRILTKKPQLGVLDGLFDTEVSDTAHGGGNYIGNLMMNMPLLGNKAAIRADITYGSDSGFVDNAVNGARDINRSGNEGIRLQALVQPTSRLSVLLAYKYFKNHEDYEPNQDIGLPRYTIARYFPELYTYKTSITSLTIDYDFDWATLTSATNYIDKTSSAAVDESVTIDPYVQPLTGIAIPTDAPLGLVYQYPDRLFTQEFRLVSKSSGPFNWIAGAWYSYAFPNNMQHFDQSLIPELAGVDLYTDASEIKKQQIAGYGQISYDLTKRLQVTAGTRVFTMKSSLHDLSNGFLNGGETTESSFYQQTSSVEKYAVNYQISHDNLVYIQASEGFRPGGPDGSAPLACAADLAALGYSSAPTQYGADKLWEYEVGSKNSLLGNRLIVDGSAYYIDWSQVQEVRNLQCGAQFTANSGNVTSKGFQMELKAEPVAGLQLSAGVAYSDAYFDTNLISVGIKKGDRTPLVPLWSGSTSAQYAFPLSESADAFVYGDYRYVGSELSDFAELPYTIRMAGYSLVDGRIGVNFGSNSLDLFAKNLLNRYAIILGASGPDATATILTPRTIGLEYQRRF
jgi:outer membrane receptor protein involved in Fe transport